MIPINQDKIEAAKTILRTLYSYACFNGMEQALVGDTLDLIAKVERYPLVYKIDVRA